MANSLTYKVKVSTAVFLAAGCALLAGSALLTLGGSIAVLDLGQRNEDMANAALAQAAPDLDRATAATTAALSQAPMTASAWARLAYIDHVRSGELTAEGLADLERSYATAPLGPDLTPWRLRFAYENWGDLTPALRQKAMAELRTLARYRGRAARDLVAEIQSPSGRLAATLTQDLARQDARQDQEARALAKEARS